MRKKKGFNSILLHILGPLIFYLCLFLSFPYFLTFFMIYYFIWSFGGRGWGFSYTNIFLCPYHIHLCTKRDSITRVGYVRWAQPMDARELLRVQRCDKRYRPHTPSFYQIGFKEYGRRWDCTLSAWTPPTRVPFERYIFSPWILPGGEMNKLGNILPRIVILPFFRGEGGWIIF